MKAFLGVFAAGVAAGLLLDPASGRERRARIGERLEPLRRRAMKARDRAVQSDTVQDAAQGASSSVAGTLTRVAQSVQGRVQSASGILNAIPGRQAAGNAPGTNGMHTAAPSDLAPREDAIDPIPEGTPNDPTLVSRVESELFRDDAIPKGALNLDAADGVVTVRGTVDPAMADEVLTRVAVVEGVVRVVDRLQRS